MDRSGNSRGRGPTICCAKVPKLCAPDDVNFRALTTFASRFPALDGFTPYSFGAGGSIVQVSSPPSIQLNANAPNGFEGLFGPQMASYNPTSSRWCFCWTGELLPIHVNNPLFAGLAATPGGNVGIHIGLVSGNFSLFWQNGAATNFPLGLAATGIHSFKVCRSGLAGGNVIATIDGVERLSVPIDANFPNVPLFPDIQLAGAPFGASASILFYNTQFAAGTGCD